MDREMQAALVADGEKLTALTGEDHGPHFFYDAPTVAAQQCGLDTTREAAIRLRQSGLHKDALLADRLEALSTITPAEVGGLVDVTQPLDDLYVGSDWACDWSDIANAIDEVRRLHASAIEAKAAELADLREQNTRMEATIVRTTARAERAEAQLAEARKALEQRDTDITEFMGRLGSRWFLEQGWFPASVGAREDDALRALTGGKEDG